MKKKCNKCENEYPATVEYFHQNKKGRYGLNSHCKVCTKEYHKQYHDRVNKTNPDYREGRRKWEQENKDTINERKRNNYDSETSSKYQREHRKSNPDWYKQYRKEYYNDPRNRLRKNMSRSLWGCLAGKEKSSNTFNYIGCSVEELWDHLESQFTQGMTRNNYGEWHVDHIKPIASFDFDSDLELELHKAWHYSNLQPLWAKDNLSKGKKERTDGKVD